MTIYLICLVAGLVFTLLSVVAGHFFGGHGDHVAGSGGHAETGADSSDMPGISIFSPTIMAAFITAFGGFGLIFSQFSATSRTIISAPLASVCALLVATALYKFLSMIFSHTQSSSESRVAPSGRHGGQRRVAHPGKWRGRDRLCCRRHALFGAGAHGKRNGRRQRQTGQDHARHRNAILRHRAD